MWHRKGRIWSQWTKAWLIPPRPLSQPLLGLLAGDQLHPHPDADYTPHADQLLILMMVIKLLGRGGGGCQGLQAGVPLPHQQLTQHNPTTMVSRQTQRQTSNNDHTSYLSFFLHMAYFWLQFFSTQKARKLRQNRFHGKSA